MRKSNEEDLGWISVKDRLPEVGHFVLTCVDGSGTPQSVGMALLLKDAVEGEITVGRLPDDWSLAYNPDELHRALLKFKSGDKVKIIIVKE